jgi:hypothetical protein
MAGTAGAGVAGAMVGSGAELAGSGVDASRAAPTASGADGARDAVVVADGNAWRGR